MKRLGGIFAGVSLMLCLLFAGMWWRSFILNDTWSSCSAGREWTISSALGVVLLESKTYTPPHSNIKDSPWRWSSGNQFDLNFYDREAFGHGRSEFRRGSEPSWATHVRYDAWWLRHWHFAVMTAAWPSLWLVLFFRRRARRPKQGFCPQCGYDLRASKERCPECGMPVVAQPDGHAAA